MFPGVRGPPQKGQAGDPARRPANRLESFPNGLQGFRRENISAAAFRRKKLEPNSSEKSAGAPHRPLRSSLPTIEVLMPPRTRFAFADLAEADSALLDVQTSANGPAGTLPFTDEMLRHAPSGDLFGWSQDVGMGWKPELLGRK